MIILLSLMVSAAQDFGKGSAEWFSLKISYVAVIRQWWLEVEKRGPEKLRAGWAQLILIM
jgi:hypothetical protein